MERLETQKKVWEEPQLVVHGDVERITQEEKVYGTSDGFTWQGQGITTRNAS
jgi:hypothetical protein